MRLRRIDRERESGRHDPRQRQTQKARAKDPSERRLHREGNGADHANDDASDVGQTELPVQIHAPVAESEPNLNGTSQHREHAAGDVQEKPPSPRKVDPESHFVHELIGRIRIQEGEIRQRREDDEADRAEHREPDYRPGADAWTARYPVSVCDANTAHQNISKAKPKRVLLYQKSRSEPTV